MTARAASAIEDLGWRPDFSHDRLRAAWDTVRLADTLLHAERHVPHYRQGWAAQGVSASDFATLADIVRFPITNKAAIAARPDAFVSEGDTPEAIWDTSGTTGRRLAVYGNGAEDAALARLTRERAAGGGRPGLLLRLLPPPRRLAVQRAAPTSDGVAQLRLAILPGYDPGIWSDAVDQLANLLFDRFLVDGKRQAVDVIHTTPPPLLAHLTSQLVARGVDPARSEVVEILTTGGYLDAASRAMLERVWAARVRSAYSCTEIRGDLPECPFRPGIYHPGPAVFAELLDPETGSPAAEGTCGMVALTGLYPYQRVMPMIRYLPGDAAERMPGPCACGSGAIALRLIGRMAHATDVSAAIGHSFYLGSADIEDAIGDCRHIPKFPYPRIGVERRMAQHGLDVAIAIEATAPAGFDAAKEGDAIARRLVAGSPTLGRAVSRGSLSIEVRVVEKGAVADHFRLYPGR